MLLHCGVTLVSQRSPYFFVGTLHTSELSNHAMYTTGSTHNGETDETEEKKQVNAANRESNASLAEPVYSATGLSSEQLSSSR
jgi:hypothetical protein